MATNIRYAIRIWSPKSPELGKWWHCQGLPTQQSFAFAILYATRNLAENATRQWKFRQAVERGGINFEIVPITCEVPE